MRCYGKADGIPDSYNDGGPLVEDTGGNLWKGGSTTLVHGKPGSFNTYTLSALKPTQGMANVMGLAANPDGSLWVGLGFPGPGLGLQQLLRGVLKPFVTPDFDGSTLAVSTLFLDRKNTLWVGTFNGMYRVHERQVDSFRSVDGLSGDMIRGFFEDREGNLWVATSKGIDMFRDLPVATFSNREGLQTTEVVSVLASRDGRLWIGGDRALESLDRNRVSSILSGKGLPGAQVTSLLEDHQGRLWVGIDNTLWRYEKGTFSRVDRSDGSRMGLITGITEDVDHNIWVEANRPPRTLVRIRDLKVQEEIVDPRISAARTLAADPQGGIWLGLTNGDLARYRERKIEVFHFEQNPDVSIQPAPGGFHWCGIKHDGLRPDRMEGRKTANAHRPERPSVRWCQCARYGPSGSAVVVHAVWTRPDCTSGTATMVGPARQPSAA